MHLQFLSKTHKFVSQYASCVFKDVISCLTLSNNYFISIVLGRLTHEKISSIWSTEISLHLNAIVLGLKFFINTFFFSCFILGFSLELKYSESKGWVDI